MIGPTNISYPRSRSCLKKPSWSIISVSFVTSSIKVRETSSKKLLWKQFVSEHNQRDRVEEPDQPWRHIGVIWGWRRLLWACTSSGSQSRRCLFGTCCDVKPAPAMQLSLSQRSRYFKMYRRSDQIGERSEEMRGALRNVRVVCSPNKNNLSHIYTHIFCLLMHLVWYFSMLTYSVVS